MKQRLIICIAFCIIYISRCVGQNEANHWYFGNGAGIDFSSGSPIVLSNSQMDNQWEGIVSISHPITGNLQFYSNGIKVWNKNHNIMPNGIGLLGDNSSAMILAIPFVNDPNKYYLFTTTSDGGDIRYSIIDMSLDGGLGDILSNSKNTLLRGNCSEKVTATTTQNGDGYWLLVHENGNNKFYAYKIDSSGINAPVLSASGTSSSYALGYMKFSHTGNKLGYVNYNSSTTAPFELYDFDKVTGLVSAPLILFERESLYSLEFSSDDSKLYISFDWGYTVQFDLSAGSLLDIQNSETALTYNAGSIQLAPNGKIYIANSGSHYLDEISLPNGAGLSCSPIENAVNLGSGECRLGLPIYIQSIFNTTTSIYEMNPVESGLNIYPNPASNSIDIQTNQEIETIRIYNNLGQKVPIKNNLTDEKHIDISMLPKGIYFLEIITKTNRISKQLIKR